MSASHERYAFGHFVLDASERLLLRERTPLPLRDKVFETLLILVRNAGRLLTKEELLEAIWPDTHVDESNLNQNISVIRRTLGDGNFIQTVPKRGFRFVAAVTRLQERAVDESKMRRRVSQLAIFATLVVAAIALPIGSDHARSEPRSLRSIAVIPFRVLGSSTDKTWVAASLSETLANRLSTVPGLLIRPASSKNDPDPIAAGERLGVDAVLTGAVQPNAGTMRITAELVDVHRRATVWSRAFDCTSADVLLIEDSLADEIGQRLRPGLTAEERARLTPPHSKDAAANDEYLRGRSLLDRRIAYDESILHFERALARDPQFALAWAGLAEALISPRPHMQPEVIARASDAARRAIRLEPTLAEGHAVLGFIHLFYEWNWTGAERELRLALRLKPGGARMHDWYAIALLTRGDTAAAIREINRAHEIDPQSADIAADVALVEYLSRDYTSAENAARAALLLGADNEARDYLVQSLKMQQRTSEALAELDAAGRRNALYLWQAAMLRSTSRNKFVADLRRAESTLSSQSPNGIAALYASAGEKEKALEWLERAYREHDFGLIFAGLAPEFDPLRADPRFHDLIRRVGVTERMPKG